MDDHPRLEQRPIGQGRRSSVAGNFVDLGVPVRFRSDGGPHFAGSEFTQFLSRWSVKAALSTPYYPQSNGHAEAAVKAMKALVKKTVQNGRIDGEEFQHALLEWRNAPRSNGISPAQMVFGNPLRSLLSGHQRSYAAEWQESMEQCDRKAAELKLKATVRYDAHARALLPLRVGMNVRIQDPVTKLWDQVGTIIGIGRHRDYRVKRPSGRILWRNRRYLQEDRTTTTTIEPDDKQERHPPEEEGERRRRNPCASHRTPRNQGDPAGSERHRIDSVFKLI